MHYACCAVSAVLSNSPVLSSPVSFSILACIFCFFARLRGWAAEEKEDKKEDEEEELRISWVVFCGWREWM